MANFWERTLSNPNSMLSRLLDRYEAAGGSNFFTDKVLSGDDENWFTRNIVPFRDPFANLAATVKTFDMPVSEAAGTLNGTNQSITTTLTAPSTGKMTIALLVKGTDTAGILASRVGVAAFAGFYAAGGSTDISSAAVGDTSVGASNFVTGVNTRLELRTALMDGAPHLVLIKGVPLDWTNVRLGDYDTATNPVAGFLAPIAVLSDAAADYADGLTAVNERYAEWVSELSL